MNQTKPLQFEINLRKFSANVVATNLWEHEKIKSKIKEYFADCKYEQKYPDSHEWRIITKEVSNQISLLSIPEELLILLQGLVKPIGEKIFYWNLVVFRCFKLLPEYSYQIYWTSFGIIDENQIFEKYWVPLAPKALDRVIQNSGQKDEEEEIHDCSLFLLACLFIQKKFIRQNLIDIIIETEMYLHPVQIGNKCSVHALIVIWFCIYSTENKEKALELYQKIKKSGHTNAYLFMMAIKRDLLEATKYSWNRLTQEEKESLIILGAGNFLSNMNKKDEEEEEESYQGKSVEILIFLLNNMNGNVRRSFISQNFMPIFQSFMKVWPFQEMAKPIIDEFIHSLRPDQVRLVLHYATACITSENDKFFSDVTRQIIPKIYEAATKDVKMLVLVQFKEFRKFFFLNLLIYYFDVQYLSLIFNDPDLSDYKTKILKKIIKKSKDLIKSRNFGLLNRFIKNVFYSETEQKEFKLKINIIPELIKERNYKLADEVINWLSVSNEEIILIKKQIDPIEICPEFKTYEQIDELLSWLYDTEDEKRKVRLAMKDPKFVYDKIIKIWNGNGQEGKKECSEFLKWLSDSEEEATALKKKLTIDENFVKHFSDTLPSPESFRTLDDLLQFLLLPPEKVLEIREKIIKELDNWIRLYVVTGKNFKMATTFINWIFADRSQKKEAMKNYINSSKGAMLLVKTYHRCETLQGEPLLSLLNSWVKQYGNLNGIKEELNLIDLMELDENVIHCDAVENLISLLKFLKGGRITNDVLNKFLIDNYAF